MPKISAILHAHNDALRIGRALDSLRPCDEVLVIDHGSTDDTIKIARKHGATVKKGLPGVEPGAYVMDARNDWILCLGPNETVAESLEASLLEFKERDDENEHASCYNLALREEHGGSWRALPPQTRLADRRKLNWTSKCPQQNDKAPTLPGELMRMEEPRARKSA
jgi:glycosyltransferase involved in cell wall biosynthesis